MADDAEDLAKAILNLRPRSKSVEPKRITSFAEGTQQNENTKVYSRKRNRSESSRPLKRGEDIKNLEGMISQSEIDKWNSQYEEDKDDGSLSDSTDSLSMYTTKNIKAPKEDRKDPQESSDEDIPRKRSLRRPVNKPKSYRLEADSEEEITLNENSLSTHTYPNPIFTPSQHPLSRKTT